MAPIKFLVLDVDGTLTDSKIHIGERGELFKAFDVKDGFAISQMLPLANITPIILTGRSSAIVEKRMHELKVKWINQGVSNKAERLKQIAIEKKLLLSECAYIGDDLNDLEAMRLCGIRACPVDAVDDIKGICDYISSFKGGCGAVRDICEYILKQAGLWEDVLAKFKN